MRQHPVGMPGHVDEQVELLRGQPHLAPLCVHASRVHVDPEVARLERARLCAPRRRAAERRAHARQELVDPERLGDVVVGAGSSASTFVRSSPFTDSTMIGTLDSSRIRRHSSTPSMCGMYRSVITSSGDHSLKLASADSPSAAVRTCTLAAEHGLEHPGNLGLIVDDEHS